MVNITAVRTALASQVGNLAFPALRSLPDLEDQINPPVGIVMPGRAPYVMYASTLAGETGFMGAPAAGNVIAPTDFALDYLIVLAKASTIERVESSLDAWLGFEADTAAVSVPAAIMDDPTLGGTVAWCLPVSADPPGPIEWNGLQYFGTRIHLSLSAK